MHSEESAQVLNFDSQENTLPGGGGELNRGGGELESNLIGTNSSYSPVTAERKRTELASDYNRGV